jgi:circadian clock protein KaiC
MTQCLSTKAGQVQMLRYFEAEGRVRRAISVVKKRSGAHEDTIREFRLTGQGVKIGPPLTEFQGILTGVPDYRGGATPLLPSERPPD